MRDLIFPCIGCMIDFGHLIKKHLQYVKFVCFDSILNELAGSTFDDSVKALVKILQ